MQSAEIDEVSNIVEMVSFVIVEGGGEGLVNIDSGSSDFMSYSLAHGQPCL